MKPSILPFTDTSYFFGSMAIMLPSNGYNVAIRDPDYANSLVIKCNSYQPIQFKYCLPINWLELTCHAMYLITCWSEDQSVTYHVINFVVPTHSTTIMLPSNLPLLRIWSIVPLSYFFIKRFTEFYLLPSSTDVNYCHPMEQWRIFTFPSDGDESVPENLSLSFMESE